MATGLFVCRHDAGRARRPGVVEVMRELDVDLADRTPQRSTRESAEQADVVVTMGCGGALPVHPG